MTPNPSPAVVRTRHLPSRMNDACCDRSRTESARDAAPGRATKAKGESRTRPDTGSHLPGLHRVDVLQRVFIFGGFDVLRIQRERSEAGRLDL